MNSPHAGRQQQPQWNRPAVQRAPLTDRQVEIMLTVLIRKPEAFVSAQDDLSPERFASHHKIYAIVWSVVCDFYAEFRQLPPENHIVGEVEHRLSENPDALSFEECTVMDQFLTMAFRVEERHLSDDVAFKYLRNYLDDQLAGDIRRDLLHGGSTPEGLFQLLSTHAERASKIESLLPTGVDLPFCDGWDEEGVGIEKVGSELQFLDAMTNGGIAKGEVILLLGPYGSCKTTISVQLACDQARRARRRWERSTTGDPLSIVYLFFYEGTMTEMRIRALSYAAKIDKDVLETGRKQNLTRDDNLRPYERELFRHYERAGRPIPGELTRYNMEQRWLNLNLRMLDMTGNDPVHPGRGTGMYKEIRRLIEADQESNRRQGMNTDVGYIIVDYVGASVERHLDANNMPRDRNLRHVLGRYPLHAKNDLAVKFHCPVLLLHQLSGQANSLAPGNLAKGTDAAECKTLKENTDWTLVISKPDDSGLANVKMDKHRRAPGMREEVIRVDGKFCRVNDTNGRYVYDHRSHKFVERGALHRIQESTGAYGDQVPSVADADDGADSQTSVISDID